MYLNNSDTIKICWYWPHTDTDTRIGAALFRLFGLLHLSEMHRICIPVDALVSAAHALIGCLLKVILLSAF